jgi:hypothetical protein
MGYYGGSVDLGSSTRKSKPRCTTPSTTCWTVAASGAHLYFGICQELRVPRWRNLLQLDEFTAATC